MAARRTLVVMEGGHPWGFRIEGGAEVREPLRINKVLGGGKAYCHGVEVGDILSSINGENASNMTISRARHLVRTSDDLLVLEVTRPGRDFMRIPEIRVISPNENLNTNGRGFQWGPNEVPDSQRYMYGMRSTPTEGGSNAPPVPPPKPARRPPLTARNPLIQTDPRKQDAPMMFTYPASPTQPTPPPRMGHSRSQGVAGGNASVVDDRTNWSQSQPSRQSTRSSTPGPRISDHPGKWTFTFYSPPTSPRSGEDHAQRRNTEPAPIKPGGLRGYLLTGKPGVVDSESFGTRKTDPFEGKPFRQQRTTDTGSVDRSLSSTAVVHPLSPTSRTSVSENQFAGGNRYVAENPYDLLPNQKMLNLQGQNESAVHYQNSYNNRNLGSPSAIPHLEKSWSKKIEDFETGYQSSASHDDSHMYADYDYLPEKPLHQNKLRNSPREHVILGDRTVFKDQNVGRGDQQVFSDKRFGGVTARQRLDEENLRRKLEIERVIAEERRRRYLKDLSDSTARRHSDYFTPLQRSSLLMDRFTDDEVADTLVRPDRRVHTKIRGKARALHTFRAQNSRELPFKRNDIIYILRQVDKNWFEGERHGMVGIFPITYVEVLTSLDQARATAELREGTATAIYNFMAQTEMELPLRKGNVVTLIRRVDENWYEGRLGRRQGIFPVTYVETHQEPETPMVTPMSSHAPTPMPGTPASCTSPVSSLYSVGPEIPSAPMSPLDSEFYESDWDTASIGALQTGRPMRTSRPTSPQSQISDREVTPVRGVVSPFFTGPANRYSYEQFRAHGRSLPPKQSMPSYSQMDDREITPVRGVRSPTPTGSANARYVFDGTRIVNLNPSLQPKPSSLAYNEFSDHEITPVREVTSPTPTGSANARYSFDGARVTNQSSSLQQKPWYNQKISDCEITPVRGVKSPTPAGSANARYSFDGARMTSQRPGLQPKPSLLSYDQISDREIMRARGVTSPPPIGSPTERYSDRIAPLNGPRVQSPSIQPKPSLHSYNQISDRDVVSPVRGITSPTPAGLGNARYSFEEARIVNERRDSQQKPSSLTYTQISDRQITPNRGVTSPTPMGSVTAQYSDRTAPQNGPRVQSPQLKPSTVPESRISDVEMKPSRDVTSPTPMVSANAQYSSSDEARIQRPSLPHKPSTLPQSQSPDYDIIVPVKAVVSPAPDGSANARLSYEDSRPQKPSLPAKPSIRPSTQNSDHEATPVRAVVSPTPVGSADARLSSEESKIPNPDLPQKSAVPSEMQPRKTVTLDPSSIKETDKPSDSIEQTQGQSQGQGQGQGQSQVQGQSQGQSPVQSQGQGQSRVQGQEKSSGVSADSSTSVKPVAATQRPPSGRSASLTLKALRQKLSFFKQQPPPQPPPQRQQPTPQPQAPTQPTESQDRRDGLSKSPRTPNPYMRCKAVYNYKPQNIDELELNRGDIIYVMEKCSDGWFVGISDKTKKFGSFPGNFVRAAW